MESIKIFQLEKNNEDIRKTVLTNTIKMLTERNLLDKNKLDKNIQTIIEKKPDDNEYKVDILPNYRGSDDTKLIIKIFPFKITLAIINQVLMEIYIYI